MYEIKIESIDGLSSMSQDIAVNLTLIF